MQVFANFLILPYQSWNKGSSVSIVSGYRLDDRAIEVRSLSEARDFSSNLSVQTGSEANPTSCPMGIMCSFPMGKARPGCDTDHSTPPNACSWMSRSYTSSPPCTSIGVSWDCFTFYLTRAMFVLLLCIQKFNESMLKILHVILHVLAYQCQRKIRSIRIPIVTVLSFWMCKTSIRYCIYHLSNNTLRQDSHQSNSWQETGTEICNRCHRNSMYFNSNSSHGNDRDITFKIIMWYMLKPTFLSLSPCNTYCLY
jgi:hypothetical protein